MKYYTQLSLVSVLLSSSMPLVAGPLDPPTAPGSTNSYSIGDICNRLDTGAAGTQIPFTEPTAAPSSTGCTFNEVMSKVPAINANGALPGDVLAGQVFWGLISGNWGLQTGTATAGANVTGTDGNLVITIPDGLYSGSQTATANDTDLTAANIKNGVNFFGTTGTYTGIGGNVQDTSSGDAVVGEILNGKKAWVDGSEVTGTLATQTPTDTTVNQPAGHYNAFDLSTVDTDLTTANIKSGVTVFGVAGDSNVVDTSSGDAVAADIASGKKAWVDGSEITGTASGGGGSVALPKTGQTTCYDEAGATISCTGTGQDGDLQKGTAWPNPRFTDNTDGTVTDNLTGLIWLKDANCIQTNYSGFDNDGTAGDGKVTWQHALDFVAGINSGTYQNCGASKTDWRLPNRVELTSLINAEYKIPALSDAAGIAKWTEGDAFSDVQTNYYWSSSTAADNTDRAWLVNLGNGTVNFGFKTTTYYIWPVRGGQ